jgi:hypothetical protein
MTAVSASLARPGINDSLYQFRFEIALFCLGSKFICFPLTAALSPLRGEGEPSLINGNSGTQFLPAI